MKSFVVKHILESSSQKLERAITETGNTSKFEKLIISKPKLINEHYVTIILYLIY